MVAVNVALQFHVIRLLLATAPARIVRCSNDFILFAAPPLSGSTCRGAYSGKRQVARGSAASWLFSSRRRALILLGHGTDVLALPNV